MLFLCFVLLFSFLISSIAALRSLLFHWFPSVAVADCQGGRGIVLIVCSINVRPCQSCYPKSIFLKNISVFYLFKKAMSNTLSNIVVQFIPWADHPYQGLNLLKKL